MLNNFIVVGGGNAGYISALILKTTHPRNNVTVIESEKIGTVGVGESSTEHFAGFCTSCGIDKMELILRAKATFKQGVYFSNWSDEDYMHNISTFTTQALVGNHFPYMQKVIAYNRPNYEMNPKGSWENKVGLQYFR